LKAKTAKTHEEQVVGRSLAATAVSHLHKPTLPIVELCPEQAPSVAIITVPHSVLYLLLFHLVSLFILPVGPYSGAIIIFQRMSARARAT
jgi:hypothetical protein